MTQIYWKFLLFPPLVFVIHHEIPFMLTTGYLPCINNFILGFVLEKTPVHVYKILIVLGLPSFSDWLDHVHLHEHNRKGFQCLNGFHAIGTIDNDLPYSIYKSPPSDRFTLKMPCHRVLRFSLLTIWPLWSSNLPYLTEFSELCWDCLPPVVYDHSSGKLSGIRREI